MASKKAQEKLISLFPTDKSLCEAANWPDYIKYQDGYKWSYEHHFMPSIKNIDIDVSLNAAMDFQSFPMHQTIEQESHSLWEIVKNCFIFCYEAFVHCLYWIFMYSPHKHNVLLDELGEYHPHGSDPNLCPSFYLKRDCPNGICVIASMSNHTKFLKTQIFQKKELGKDFKESMKFLLHFVGDSHQVLHLCNTLKGGNLKRVTFNSSKTDLHSVWDTDILMSNVEKYGSLHAYYEHLLGELNRLSYLQRYNLIYHDVLQDTIKGSPKSAELDIEWFAGWASEIHCKFGDQVWDLPTLDEDLFTCGYLEKVSPIITELLMTAGLRLSFILDQIFN